MASLLGAAGGELLFPTLVLLFGADVKLAGSLSLAVSLPTMLVGFARYSQDQSFSTIRRNGRFMLRMAAGSVVVRLLDDPAFHFGHQSDNDSNLHFELFAPNRPLTPANLRWRGQC